MNKKKIINIGKVEELLNSGKKVTVKTINGEYTKIKKFVNKGILDTYLVKLKNNYSIKVSKNHKFFTSSGWIECKDLIPNKHSILCDNKRYNLVLSVDLIGKYKIVDIEVDHPDHCYFGNSILNHNTGKSLMCASIIAETQKRNGLAVFFDSEFSVDRKFWVALGVNIKNVNYVPFTTLEEFFTKFELCIGAFRKKCPDRLLTILVDSATQASVEKEMESDHGVDGYNTGRAIIISKAMRKCTGLIARQRILPIFTNQVRHNMNAGPFGEKWIVPGGKALPFACSVRIRLVNTGKLKMAKTKDVIGMACQAQVIKNRCGPNFRIASFDIHYDSGIQDLASWLKFMKLHGIITGDGRKYTYKRLNGEVIDFNTSKFVELANTDSELRKEMYEQICDKYIMQYRDPNSKIVEDVERTLDKNDDISKNAIDENESD